MPFNLDFVHYIRTTPSTNTLALEAAQRGETTGVWIADEQTAGRGRGGHAWHSPAFVDGYPAGLYVSVLVRPRLIGAEALKLSLAAGLAAQAAIAEVSALRADLRWPNDLMLPSPDGTQKKLGGILTESSMEASGSLAYAVIGIGINLNQTAFPPELAPLATSLRVASGKVCPREPLLTSLLKHLSAEIAVLESDLNSITQRFEQASSWTCNFPVHVDEGDGYTGITCGLNSEGLLLVRLDDGTVRTVRHGGVRRN